MTGRTPKGELCPLGVPPAVRFLDDEGLDEAAVPLGLCDSSLSEADLDPDPRPSP